MDCSPISASIRGKKGPEASCFRVRFAESTVDEDGASVLPSLGKGMEVTVMIKKQQQQFGQAGLSMASKQHPDIILLITKGQGNLTGKNVT